VALPLGIRNRLAELILNAFDNPEARRTLRALAAFCEAGPSGQEEDSVRLLGLGWFGRAPAGGLVLLGAHRDLRDAICSRAHAAARVLESPPTANPGVRLGELLDRAVRLADGGLYFEVHELLEPAWLQAEGAERRALQGLIQVAVALHHVQNGNAPGAVSRLAEGVAKLRAAGGVLPFDLVPWIAALEGLVARLRAGGSLGPAPSWPRLEAFRGPRPSA
jgi:hypothetical protein